MRWNLKLIGAGVCSVAAAVVLLSGTGGTEANAVPIDAGRSPHVRVAAVGEWASHGSLGFTVYAEGGNGTLLEYVSQEGGQSLTSRSWSSTSLTGGQQAFGGPVVVAPAQGWSGNQFRDVIYVAADGSLRYSRTYDFGGFDAPVALPEASRPAGEVTVVADPDGRYGQAQLFWRDSSNRLQHDYMHGNVWLSGPALANDVAGDPVAVTTGAGTDVFYRATDGLLHHVWYVEGRGWSPKDGALPTHGTVPGRITAVATGATSGVTENVFWRDGGGNLQQDYLNVVNGIGTWTFSSPLATGLSGDPVALKPGSRIDLFFPDKDGIRRMTWGPTWSSSTIITKPGTTVGSPITAVNHNRKADETLLWYSADTTDSTIYGTTVAAP